MSSSTGASVSNKNQLRQRRKGPVVPDLNEQEPQFISNDKVKKTQKRNDWLITILLTLWACYIRLWKISQPSSVVFDVNELICFNNNKKLLMLLY